MKKLEYADEATFETEEIIFTDKHYNLAKKLHELYNDDLRCSPLMVKNDKKSLVFVINLGDKTENRVAYERGDDSYKIIIEKINSK